MRGRNLVKMFRAIQLISRKSGATIKELEEGLEIDRRSVYRLLATMQELGFPIYDEQPPMERGKRWRFEESYLRKLPNMDLPEPALTLAEATALHLLKAEAGVYKGTEIEEHVNSAFAKIDAFAPLDLVEKFSRIRTLFVSTNKLTKDYTGKERIIDTLTRAMLAQHTCRVRYYAFWKEDHSEFDMDPLHFFEHGGGLYLFVRVVKYGDIRVLAVERIEALEVLERSFEPPGDFDPEARLLESFDVVFDDPVEARIWFSAHEAKYVLERSYCKDQQVTENEDGSIVLELKTSGVQNVKKWVMSFGAGARVLAPGWLRDEVRGELELAHRGYYNTMDQSDTPGKAGGLAL